MNRLYALRKLRILTKCYAVNIYDIKEKSIDARAYLEIASKKSLPTILQISQNASGQKENYKNKIKWGYLKPENGINDFTSAVSKELINLINYCTEKILSPPFFGIGLDHVDVKGDFPKGRSKRFIKDAQRQNWLLILL